MSKSNPEFDGGLPGEELKPKAARALIDGLQSALPEPEQSAPTEISNIIRSGNDLSPLPQQMLKRISWMALPMLVTFGITTLLAGHATVRASHPMLIFDLYAIERRVDPGPVMEKELVPAEMNRLVLTFPSVPASQSLVQILADADSNTAFRTTTEAPAWWKDAVKAEKMRRKSAANNSTLLFKEGYQK